MTTFGPVLQVADVMRGFPCPWYIAGGWAIDLFLGHTTRDHDDIDVAILRKNQADLRTHLSTWRFGKVVEGRRLPWADGERLDPPVHEVQAASETGARIEFLFNESSGARWRFRRNPAIRRRLDRIGIRTPAGIPFLVPEIVLLFKAKAPTAKDRHDFDLVQPRLMAEPRRWLKDALETCHPGHPWIARL